MDRLTLEEAIKHCKKKVDCSPCGQEHKQLAEWLKELKRYKDAEEQGLFVRQQFGRWEKDNNNPKDGNYTCSCCKEGVDIATGEETPIDRGLNYCPNCGAKM